MESAKFTLGQSVQSLGIGLFVAALLAVQAALSEQVWKHETAWVLPPSEEVVKWDPQLMRILSVGHAQSLTSWLLMRTLTDPAIAHVVPGTHPKIYYDLLLATDLDPAFEDLYYLGSNFLAVIRDDGPGALDLLMRAKKFVENDLDQYPPTFRERHWKNLWRLHVYLAYVQLFELKDLPSASESFLAAAAIPGSPRYLASMKSRLEKKGGQYEVGLRLLEFFLRSTDDPKLQAEYERKAHSLRLAEQLFFLNDEFARYKGSLSGFLAERGYPSHDIYGGLLSVNDQGRIVTTTPYEPVFGLE